VRVILYVSVLDADYAASAIPVFSVVAGFPAPTSCPTSMSARDAILIDRKRKLTDRKVSQSRPSGMVLRSHSRAGRSEVIVSAEIHPERPRVAPRPGPEIARPEVEFAPVAGPSSDPTAVGTSSPSPHTRCGTEIVTETLSGYPFPARHEPEIAPIPFPSFHP